MAVPKKRRSKAVINSRHSTQITSNLKAFIFCTKCQLVHLKHQHTII